MNRNEVQKAVQAEVSKLSEFGLHSADYTYDQASQLVVVAEERNRAGYDATVFVAQDDDGTYSVLLEGDDDYSDGHALASAALRVSELLVEALRLDTSDHRYDPEGRGFWEAQRYARSAR